MINTGEPVNLLDRPKLPELSLNGAELSVNGASPHIDDQPPEPPADPGGDPMKDYCIEMVFKTRCDYVGAGVRCADTELVISELMVCVSLQAPNRAEALCKALTAAGTALHDAATAVLNWENTLTKQSVAAVEQFLDSRPWTHSRTGRVDPWPWKWLVGKDDRIWVAGVGVHPSGLDEAVE